MKKITTLTTILIYFSCFGAFASEATKPLKFYIDADFSTNKESSISIEQGIKTALDRVDSKIGGRKIIVERANHRGNSVRSKVNLKKIFADEQALAVFSGLHSPPVLANRDLIVENGMVLLDPWAAAGPITRSPLKNNSIFRLSIDDSKAGEVMVDYALKKYKRPILVLENTGWGKSNSKNMLMALKKRGIKNTTIKWFDWNLKSSGAKSIVRSAREQKADVILLVSNYIEGAVIINELANSHSKKTIPVISHWGITGGKFTKVVSHATRQKVSLRFLQTKFSFQNKKLNNFQKETLNRARKLFPELKGTSPHPPAGFIHAHDITLLAIEALKGEKLNQDIKTLRNKLRVNLENISKPVNGLIKTYKRPFGKYSKKNKDAHEALNSKDFAFGKYNKDGRIVLEEI